MSPGWEAKFLEGPPTIHGMYPEIDAILLCANMDELKVIVQTQRTHISARPPPTVPRRRLSSSMPIFPRARCAAPLSVAAARQSAIMFEDPPALGARSPKCPRPQPKYSRS